MLSNAFGRIFLLIPSLFSVHLHSNFFIRYFRYYHLYLIQTYFLEDSKYYQKPLKILKMPEKPFLMSNQLHVADLKLSMKFGSIFLFRLEKGGQYNSLLKYYFFFHFLLEIAVPVENFSNFKQSDFIDLGMSF
jgi:hypothetical protein